MTDQARWNGEAVLLAGESIGEQQNIAISLEDFNEMFAPHLGPLDKSLPYEALDKVWQERIAPQRESPPTIDSPEN